MTAEDRDLARLRWRCRRGLLELDLVFERFLNQSYPTLTPAERAAFEKFLQLADTDLLAYVHGTGLPTEPEFSELVKKIRL